MYNESVYVVLRTTEILSTGGVVVGGERRIKLQLPSLEQFFCIDHDVLSNSNAHQISGIFQISNACAGYKRPIVRFCWTVTYISHSVLLFMTSTSVWYNIASGSFVTYFLKQEQQCLINI